MVFIYGYATQLYLNVEKLRHKMPTVTIDINGRLNGDNLHITLKINTLAPRHLKKCLLGTPHHRSPIFVSREQSLPLAHISRPHTPEIAVKSLDIHTAGLHRKSHSHKVPTMRNRDMFILKIVQQRFATWQILDLGCWG